MSLNHDRQVHHQPSTSAHRGAVRKGSKRKTPPLRSCAPPHTPTQSWYSKRHQPPSALENPTKVRSHHSLIKFGPLRTDPNLSTNSFNPPLPPCLCFARPASCVTPRDSLMLGWALPPPEGMAWWGTAGLVNCLFPNCCCLALQKPPFTASGARIGLQQQHCSGRRTTKGTDNLPV